MQKDIIIKRSMKCQWVILSFLLTTSVVSVCLDSISFAANDSDMAIEAIQFRIKGYTYQRQGDFPKAIENYKKAVERNPFYACAHNDLGILYEQVGRPNQAEQEYLNAIKIDQDYVSAYSNLALLYERQNKIEEACYYWGIRAQMGDLNNQWTQAAKKKYAELSVELSDRQRSKRVSAVKKQIVNQGMSQEQMDMAEANDSAKKFAVEKNKENKNKQKELKDKQRNDKLCKDYFDNATRMVDDGNYDSAIKQYNQIKSLDKNYQGIDYLIKEAQDKSIEHQYQIKMQADQQRKAKEDALQKKQELKEKGRLERELQGNRNEINKKKTDEQAKIYSQKQREQERLKRDQEYQDKKAKEEAARIEKNKQKKQEGLKKEQDRKLKEQANEQARLERLRNKQKAHDAKLVVIEPEINAEARLKEDSERLKAYQGAKEKEAQAKRDFEEKTKTKKEKTGLKIKAPAPITKKEQPVVKKGQPKQTAVVKEKKKEAPKKIDDAEKEQAKIKKEQEAEKQKILKEVDNHFTRGQNLYLASRYEEAAKEFEAALAINPNHADSGRMLRYCQRRTQSGYYRPLEESIAESSNVSSKQQPVSVSVPVESSLPPAVTTYKEPVMESPEAVEKRVSQEIKQEEKSSSDMTSADIEKKYQVIGVVAYRSESNNIDTLNEELLKKAKDIGAGEVIQVRYFQNNNYVYGYGTAVNKKKK